MKRLDGDGMKVSFIGLGIMGSRMALNLQGAGHTLTVYNRTQNKGDALVAAGATRADSPAEAAKNVDILLTMLAHPEAVEEAALGQNGFLGVMNKGALWVDSSTVHPTFSRRMAKAAAVRGVRFLDAPVAGTKAPAENAELVFFVGGDAADLKEASPLFDAMGKKTVHVGEHGMGTSLKLVVNMMLATSMLAFAEGVVFGQTLGLSEETLFNALIGGPLVPAYLGIKRQSLERDDYEASFPLKWLQKDMQMVANAAYDVGAAMPVANLTKELYQMAVQAGHGDEDFGAIYQDLKTRAG